MEFLVFENLPRILLTNKSLDRRAPFSQQVPSARPPSPFVPTNGFDATISGNAVYIDGVALQAGDGSQTSATGELAAQLQIRDNIAPAYQSQLDEIARGLVVVFAEHDQSGSALPDLPGLFTWSGGTVPSAATIEPGISATL